MNLGPLEIVVILVVALLVFGPKRLPEVGRQVGGALREIRKVQDNVRSEISAVLNAETDKPGVATPAGAGDSPAARDVEPDHDDGPAPESPIAGTEAVEPPVPGAGTDTTEPEPGFEGPSGSFS